MIALPPEPRSGCPTVEAMSFEQQAAVLRAVFETAPDGLVTIDRAGLICAFNPAAERMFGYQSAEVIGRNVNCLMPPPFHAEHDGYIARYLRTGEKRIIGIGREVAAAKKDGTVFPIELAVGEVALGEQRLFAGFICDISERHAAERNLIELRNELLHVSRLSEMGEMASALAHELNQPLTAIINYLEASRRLLERQATPAGKAGELMAKASDQASRAGQIIQHLRRFIAKGETETDECDDGDTDWSAGESCNGTCQILACGDPDDTGTIRASDALLILRVAVGSATCEACVCNVDSSSSGSPVSASDALRVLRAAVGTAVEIVCPACV
jgi:PAS domain S-box-containing protein